MLVSPSPSRLFGRYFMQVILGIIAWGVSPAFSSPLGLLAISDQGAAIDKAPVEMPGSSIPAWVSLEKSKPVPFRLKSPEPLPPDGNVYLSVSYVDQGYGKLGVQLLSPGAKPTKPSRSLGLYRTNSKSVITARMKFTGVPSKAPHKWSVRIAMEGANDEPLAITDVSVQDTPFDDPAFKLVISEPWKSRYQGPSVKPKDNATLKGKVMAGYQGWFRTPNDLEGRGWVHWGNIPAGNFSIDMWPDTSQYPPSALEKAGEVKLKSGKQARLFSSTWPAVVDTHFRWMREHDIDGAFLQRFVSKRFHSISGGPEWVLANTRASANREGRIWAIEYDISGCPESELLATMQTDWKWLVDEFRLFEDPNYAREGTKPVVFIWGLPFPNRNISAKTADAVVEFFKNDPKYGGNHVIGGIPSSWRKMDAAWQDHFKKYETILTWMPKSPSEDLKDFTKMGIHYYPHVKPGFSWANLKHLPTGDDEVGYTPREGGQFYWNQLTDVAQAGGDRLFVGMFDEYDEATAIMPMSDDSPPTPQRTGVGATFYNGANAGETGELVLLPRAELAFGASPAEEIQSENFFVRMGGRVTFPEAGSFTFSVQSAPGDGVELFLNGESVLRSATLKDAPVSARTAVKVAKGDSMAYRLDCRHRTGKGSLKLLWETPAMTRQAVPATALQDAWGRFITNEGKSPLWWLELTRKGKEMINGKRNPSASMPDLAVKTEQSAAQPKSSDGQTKTQ